MLIKRFILVFLLSSFLIGCASQPPAPVYGNGAPIYSKTKPSLRKSKAQKPIKAEPINQGSNDIVTTQPLQEFVPITTPIEALAPEPLIPDQQQQEQGQGQNQPAQAPSAASQESLETGEVPSAAEPEALPSTQHYSSPGLSIEPAIVAPPPPPIPSFSPLESFAPLSPAVNALTLAANQNSKSGNIESATTTIERAIRIEPRNATLYYKLALLKLKQSKPRLAEDLAKKAAILASNDIQLKKHSWLLVARAREVQGDLDGGKEARTKAAKF
jgi:tetratricopeptide (TPR) repeat protein